MTRSEILHRLTKLRRDRTTGRWGKATCGAAPHKPLLLLSVIDAVEAGDLTEPLVQPSTPILEGFQRYWYVVMPPDRRGDVFKPFFHLRSEGFWELRAQPGSETTLPHLKTLTSNVELQRFVLGATLDPLLSAMMHDPADREVLRNALLQANFSAPVQEKLRRAIVTNGKASRYAETLLHCAEIAEAPRPFVLEGDEAEAEDTPGPVRKAAFRRAVVRAYAYRCAICGIRMITPNGHSVVEAAHIIPWARTHHDDVRNGLSLCRLCHWAFDELLVSVDLKHRLLISDTIHGNDNMPGHMSAFSGRELILPENIAYYPLPEALADHCGRFRNVG